MVEGHNLFQHFKPLWPVLAAAAGFLIAIFVAMRYKLPALIKRVDNIETVAANNKDLERAISDFQTVCRFNQVSCQKEMEHRWAKIERQHEERLGELYERLNELMVENGKLVAKVDFLINDRTINGNHLN